MKPPTGFADKVNHGEHGGHGEKPSNILNMHCAFGFCHCLFGIPPVFPVPPVVQI